jgi:hypothetical protein
MANTNKGRKLYICATAQPTDLAQGGYEALTWVEVKNTGSIGETGTAENILTYPELATEVAQKQKGIANAGDPDIEVARNPTDPGQILLRTAGATKFYYAFKVEDQDRPSADYTNTIYYMRGLVSMPKRPNGRNEDFILEVYTLGMVQKEIVVNPAPGSVPVNVTPPSISSSGMSNTVVQTAVEGTWTNDPTSFTYQWQKDTAGNKTYVNISGATSKTFTATTAGVGATNGVRCQVTAINGAGASSVANTLGVIFG